MSNELYTPPHLWADPLFNPMEIEVYCLPEHWACALINDDRTGMSDAEESAMDRWLADTFEGKAYYCLGLPDGDDGPEFMRYHDASRYVLACDCVRFSFDVTPDR